MKILFIILSTIFCFFINGIIYRNQIKKEIRNNIDLFVKRHNELVIKEINNELFKKDLEVIDEKK